MKEALLYKLTDKEKCIVQCSLCNHRCTIKNGHTGICSVRKNIDGKLVSLVYDSLISENIDPIEKKPIFHVRPGSLSYSVATVGCNFRCHHCQNYDISQFPVLHPDTPIPGKFTKPGDVVQKAANSHCASISYTYIEPTIFFEFALETAQEAHAKQIKNIFVSNGYTSPEAARLIAPFLDANNIDLKAFTDKFYKEVCGAKLAPVLDTIQLMKELGVWVEVTTLIIPGWNDSDNELQDIARFLVSIDPNIPWHVSRFYPTYKMTDRPPTDPAALHRAREIGSAEGLLHIYTGNIPGQGGENTICPGCSKVVIERLGYSISEKNMEKGSCSFCGHQIAGIW